MKSLRIINRVSLLIILMTASIFSIAQDKIVDVEITTKKTTQWYLEPWVLVVAGGVFVLILVALLRNNKSRA